MRSKLNLQHLESRTAPPLPLSHTLGAASGCLQWQVPSPDMHVQTKIGSSCVRWPAIAGAHPGLAVEKKRRPFFWCLLSSPPWPAAAVISYCSGISACEKGGQFQLAWQALLLPSAPVREVGNGRKHWDWFYGCDTIIWLLDVISYTFVIIACEKGGKWQQALGLLQECDTMFFFW